MRQDSFSATGRHAERTRSLQLVATQKGTVTHAKTVRPATLPNLPRAATLSSVLLPPGRVRPGDHLRTLLPPPLRMATIFFKNGDSSGHGFQSCRTQSDAVRRFVEVLNIEKMTECLAIIFGETFCNLLNIKHFHKTPY